MKIYTFRKAHSKSLGEIYGPWTSFFQTLQRRPALALSSPVPCNHQESSWQHRVQPWSISNLSVKMGKHMVLDENICQHCPVAADPPAIIMDPLDVRLVETTLVIVLKIGVGLTWGMVLPQKDPSVSWSGLPLTRAILADIFTRPYCEGALPNKWWRPHETRCSTLSRAGVTTIHGGDEVDTKATALMIWNGTRWTQSIRWIHICPQNFYHIVNPSQARNPYSNNNQDQHLEKDCKRFIFLVSISTILSPSLLLDSGM